MWSALVPAITGILLIRYSQDYSGILQIAGLVLGIIYLSAAALVSWNVGSGNKF